MATISDADLKLIFTDAHTSYGFLDQPVDDALLKQIYDIAKIGPTSANSQPMRVSFVKSKEAKEKLKPALSPGNVDKTMAAPVTAIVAFDLEFAEKMDKLAPPMKAGMQKMPEAKRDEFVLRNSTLQGAYMIIAARALGLDCGPMSGFDNKKLDEAFFPEGKWKSNFLINLGHGEPSKFRPRSPRLDFDEACKIE